jgi:hypothetical protein
MIANGRDAPFFLAWSGFASLSEWGRYQNIRVTLAEVVGKLRELRKEARYCAFQQATALLPLSLSGYSPDVAAHSAIGRETPGTIKAQSATEPMRRFFSSANRFYGGCAWEAFGPTGYLDCRVSHHARLPPRF